MADSSHRHDSKSIKTYADGSHELARRVPSHGTVIQGRPFPVVGLCAPLKQISGSTRERAAQHSPSTITPDVGRAPSVAPPHMWSLAMSGRFDRNHRSRLALKARSSERGRRRTSMIAARASSPQSPRRFAVAVPRCATRTRQSASSRRSTCPRCSAWAQITGLGGDGIDPDQEPWPMRPRWHLWR
jgi:hypothetical protein